MINESGNQIAVVANQIVHARHRLDPRQQKVLAWAIAQIARDDADFMTHTLTVSEFARLTGAENDGRIYSNMEHVTTSLLRSVLEIRIQDGDRTRVKFQWLSRCRYQRGKGTVEIKFHEELRPYLLELKSRFTQLRLENFYRFKSSYTIRFYERIEMQRGLNRPSWKMSLDELRDWLGIERDAYKFFGLLRAKVLDISQAELDRKSDWSYSFELVKTGRKITHVEFTIRAARTSKVNPMRERWKKASPALKKSVLAEAKSRPRWEEKTDSEILDDSTFWENLGVLFDVVEKGQSALGLE